MNTEELNTLHGILLENCKNVSEYEFAEVTEEVRKLSGSKMQVKTSENNGKEYLFNI